MITITSELLWFLGDNKVNSAPVLSKDGQQYVHKRTFT